MEAILREIQLEYLGLTEDEANISNPMLNRTKDDIENPHLHVLRLMRNPDYFYFTCKALMNGPNGEPLELLPFQCAMLKELWTRPFPMLIASRGAGKSFILGLYALLRALLIQGRKVVITGSGFRQAKTVFNYAESIWHRSPVLQSLVAENSRSGPHHDADRWTLVLGHSEITALPLGDGTKIRGQRANDVIADEFASIPWEIFDTVVGGFGVVSLDPVKNVKDRARIRVLKKRGRWTAEAAERHRKETLSNQTIISGTAFYQFNHFARYWKLWKLIISSKGDPKVLKDHFPNGIDEHFDWRDYSVIRIPVELLPEGFMDEKQVAQARARQHTGTFANEFGACFSSDSNGFFKRSLIETCIASNQNFIVIDGDPIIFRAMTRGNPDGAYVYGIDPASEQDNFSIVILEVHPTHRRIVYGWSTTREGHKQRVKAGATKETDFYGYCARKIRELMSVFPCEHIAMDSQGGGIAVMEALHDQDKMEPGEKPIWPISVDHPLSDGKERDTDIMPGLHILEMVNFSNFEYTATANHGMRKDFEDRVLLFPEYDTGILASAMEDDQRQKRVFDTLEDSVQEIEETKEELATIIMTRTAMGNRDRWDTPEVKLEGMKKGRLRKDRYSALLMANMAARRMERQLVTPEYVPYGGFVGQMGEESEEGPMWVSAPGWYTKTQTQSAVPYGYMVDRSGVVE